MVRLDPSRGSSLTMILNKEPDRSGGVGGWESVDRALRRGARWWRSWPDDTMSLDCTIDIDAIGGPSVERRIRVLRDMGQPGDADDPPTIKLSGDIWDSDCNATWVMDGWSLGTRLYLPDGTMRRQQVTVELSRYEAVEDVTPIKIRSTRTKGKKRRTHSAVVRSGENLRAVSLRELGSPTRWRDLQRWNKKLRKVDPDLPLRAGTHVTIRG